MRIQPQTKNAITTAAKIQNSAMSLMLVSLRSRIIISVIAVGTAFPNIGHRIITLATTRPKIEKLTHSLVQCLEALKGEKRPAVAIPHDEAGRQFFDRPGRRKPAGRHLLDKRDS